MRKKDWVISDRAIFWTLMSLFAIVVVGSISLFTIGGQQTTERQPTVTVGYANTR
jgi:hypothetical protein